jgi:hypothetical protein
MHGGDPPADFQRVTTQETQRDSAHEATEQKRLPGRPQTMLEPIPGQLEFEVMRTVSQQPSPNAVGGKIDRYHRERIHDVASGHTDRDIQARPDTQQHHQRQMDRQRDETDADSDAKRCRDGMAVQRPQMCIRESIAEHAQVPLVAASTDEKAELFDESAGHGYPTLTVACLSTKHHVAKLRCNAGSLGIMIALNLIRAKT